MCDEAAGTILEGEEGEEGEDQPAAGISVFYYGMSWKLKSFITEIKVHVLNYSVNKLSMILILFIIKINAFIF